MRQVLGAIGVLAGVVFQQMNLNSFSIVFQQCLHEPLHDAVDAGQPNSQTGL